MAIFSIYIAVSSNSIVCCTEFTNQFILQITHEEVCVTHAWGALHLQIVLDRIPCVIMILWYLYGEAAIAMVSQILGQKTVPVHIHKIRGFAATPVF